MAFTASRSRIAPCAAEKEVTYGSNPTIAGADDGFNTIDSTISASPEVQNTEFRNHGASLTRGKNVNVVCPLPPKGCAAWIVA